MKEVFADAYFFIAVLNSRDAGHHRAITMMRSRTALLVTTHWVLIEVGDAMAAATQRGSFASLLDILSSDDTVRIVPASAEAFERGVALFRRRADKAWSLTDCLRLETMAQEGIAEALTADHHFEQAGFVALLAER
jgi:uncharacterized protein